VESQHAPTRRAGVSYICAFCPRSKTHDSSLSLGDLTQRKGKFCTDRLCGEIWHIPDENGNKLHKTFFPPQTNQIKQPPGKPSAGSSILTVLRPTNQKSLTTNPINWYLSRDIDSDLHRAVQPALHVATHTHTHTHSGQNIVRSSR